MAHVRRTVWPISNATAGGAGYEGDGSEERLSLRELVTRVCLVMVAMLGQKVLARLPSTSDPRP
jgi:hypothetical protein